MKPCIGSYSMNSHNLFRRSNDTISLTKGEKAMKYDSFPCGFGIKLLKLFPFNTHQQLALFDDKYKYST